MIFNGMLMGKKIPLSVNSYKPNNLSKIYLQLRFDSLVAHKLAMIWLVRVKPCMDCRMGASYKVITV